MAQAVAGQAHLGALRADEFLSQAELIASLRREEVILLSYIHAAWNERWVEPYDRKVNNIEAMRSVQSKLIPDVFSDEDAMRAMLGGLTRTSLIEAVPSLDFASYEPTVFLDRLVRLTPLASALEREGFGQ